ncbi:Putative nickel insertion protein [Geodia barretti]|uniref:Nickel insertion protein n=1 Tax=Geodia barretti TaxID=519541 RepID=A0AA35RUJ4_GEOBA|nr:Putative nickel insertion protein [Geodia barretti]
MKAAYIQFIGGASGDMLLGALIDLGLSLEELRSSLSLLSVDGYQLLGIPGVYAAPLVLGVSAPPRWPGGYSNPAPATLELVALAKAPIAPELSIHQGAGELTTPTGAAIIASLAQFQRPAMTVEGIGVGLGSKDPEAFPNVVRIWVGEVAENPAQFSAIGPRQQGIVLLETNLDDVTGEVLGYAQERLFDLGALDVWHTPIQMKKNRPGIILSALLPQSLEQAGVELILRETPTLGVRSRPVERYAAERRIETLETDLGQIRVKLKYLAGGIVAAAPEYEDCRRIALESDRSLMEIYRKAETEAQAKFLT